MDNETQAPRPQDLPAAGPWVPVGERLPKPNCKRPFLLRTNWGTTDMGWIAQDVFLNEDGRRIYNVTHWAEIRLPGGRG